MFAATDPHADVAAHRVAATRKMDVPMRCQPFHSTTSMYYHDNDGCKFSGVIATDDRIAGTGGLSRCVMCQRLDDSASGDGRSPKPSGHKSSADDLERSFLKQNFGTGLRRDLDGDPIPDEESRLIDADLAHLREKEGTRADNADDGMTA